tara:strand:+ start:656 stop:853 length:198 start_codon:yes stop_codon:yes gene_type:complete
MYLCSGVPGNKCGVIPTPTVMFNDHYDCMVYAYNYSLDLIPRFGREWFNEKIVYTKFSCVPEQII